MYATCLFCKESLGRNDVIETFPIGRRLAYDASRGRLWVVCRACERWNLTPLEVRWEAIEDAERQFRATRLRVSTDHVGLARLKEGLELVRIGAPLRPELAAWRYGDQFGRRFKRHVAISIAATSAVAATIVVGPVMGLVSIGSVSPVLNVLNMLHLRRRLKRVIATTHVPGYESPLEITSAHLRAVRLQSDRRGGFTLHVEGSRRDKGSSWNAKGYERAGSHDIAGDEAIRLVGALLPTLNANGAGRRVVQDAVGLLETARTPAETFALVAEADRQRRKSDGWGLTDPGALFSLPMAARLALEMASHEEGERRALEGELAELERAWRDAEEIAGIADDLGLPRGVHAALARIKGAVGRADERIDSAR